MPVHIFHDYHLLTTLYRPLSLPHDPSSWMSSAQVASPSPPSSHTHKPSSSALDAQLFCASQLVERLDWLRDALSEESRQYAKISKNLSNIKFFASINRPSLFLLRSTLLSNQSCVSRCHQVGWKLWRGSRRQRGTNHNLLFKLFFQRDASLWIYDRVEDGKPTLQNVPFDFFNDKIKGVQMGGHSWYSDNNI